MSVSDQAKAYTESLPKWRIVRDCVDGAQAIKSRPGKGSGLYSLAGAAYLPPPNPDDESADNKSRYRQYRERANFVNFTGFTKDGMLGLAFRSDPEIDLPGELDYLLEDADGGGIGLVQLSKGFTAETLETGRHGVLVDYPEVDGNPTKAQIAAKNIRPRLADYAAESIINWRTTYENGVKKLSLVVLYEPKEVVSEDGFTSENADQWRVLRLVDGVYVQQIYNKDEELESEYTPRRSNGSTWDEIPFVFIGAVNNDEIIDNAPLYDIAEVNVAHYHNSADYEESCFVVGQPTTILSGLTVSWVKEIFLDQPIQLGSRRAIPLPEGAQATLLQAAPNQPPSEGMKEKEGQMIKIGTRMIVDPTGVETAEAAKIRYSGQNSKLDTLVSNVESGINNCLEWCLEFTGGQGEITFQMNHVFYDSSISPQQITTMMLLSDRGDIAQTDIQDALRKANWIDKDRTSEDIAKDFTNGVMPPMNPGGAGGGSSNGSA